MPPSTESNNERWVHLDLRAVLDVASTADADKAVAEVVVSLPVWGDLVSWTTKAREAPLPFSREDFEEAQRLVNEGDADGIAAFLNRSVKARGALAAARNRAATHSDQMSVRLSPAEADALLALAEWALNRPDLDLGPGLPRHLAEEGARAIESVADMRRQGIEG